MPLATLACECARVRRCSSRWRCDVGGWPWCCWHACRCRCCSCCCHCCRCWIQDSIIYLLAGVHDFPAFYNDCSVNSAAWPGAAAQVEAVGASSCHRPGEGPGCAGHFNAIQIEAEAKLDAPGVLYIDRNIHKYFVCENGPLLSWGAYCQQEPAVSVVHCYPVVVLLITSTAEDVHLLLHLMNLQSERGAC